MRITNKNLFKNYMNNLNRNLGQMQKYENQLSSGKEVSRPSDDPFRLMKAMGWETSISQNNQYADNIEDGIGWLDTTDTAVKGLIDTLQRVRELTVQGSSGTNSPTDDQAIASEIKETISQIAQIGNANYGGRYILGGHTTTKPPLTVDATTHLLSSTNMGDSGRIKREISTNVTMDINISTGDFLGTSTAEDLGTTLKNIYDRMMVADQGQLAGDSLGNLDKHLDRLLGLYAEVGAKSNRLTAAKEKNEQETLSMTDLLSKAEDIDFAEKTMQYSMMETVYKASLSTGGKILQPTLLDYLR